MGFAVCLSRMSLPIRVRARWVLSSALILGRQTVSKEVRQEWEGPDTPIVTGATFAKWRVSRRVIYELLRIGAAHYYLGPVTTPSLDPKGPP